jgi:hypothetical protein
MGVIITLPAVTGQGKHGNNVWSYQTLAQKQQSLEASPGIFYLIGAAGQKSLRTGLRSGASTVQLHPTDIIARCGSIQSQHLRPHTRARQTSDAGKKRRERLFPPSALQASSHQIHVTV